MGTGDKKCKNPKCLPCNWWPKIYKMLGDNAGTMWVDSVTGELMIATGLRASPSGKLAVIPEEESPKFYKTICDCGQEMHAREDLMSRGFVSRCDHCSACLAETMRN